MEEDTTSCSSLTPDLYLGVVPTQIDGTWVLLVSETQNVLQSYYFLGEILTSFGIMRGEGRREEARE